MHKRKDGFVILILAAGDVLALSAIFIAAIWLRQVLLGAQANWEDTLLLVQLGLAYCVGAFFVLGLYPGYGLTAVKELEYTSKAISLAFFVLAATAYLNKPFQAFSRAIVLSAWLLATLIRLGAMPAAYRSIIAKWSWCAAIAISVLYMFKRVISKAVWGWNIIITFYRCGRGWLNGGSI